MSTILSVDIGTTKICALAYCPDSGTSLAIRSAPNDATLESKVDGRHEQDPIAIGECCLQLLRNLLSDSAVSGDSVEAIAFSAQMHGLLLVNQALEPLTPFITWRDQRAASDGLLDHARKVLGPDLALRTGCELNAGYGGVTLHWLSNNGALTPNSKALGIGDFVAASLCGRVATEPTVAASWGILDLRSGRWDLHCLEALSIPSEALPPIVSSASPLGSPLPDQAALLQLPRTVQVCAPLGDNQASVIGAAGLCPDAAIANLGTGGQISIHKDDFAYCDGLETRPMPSGGFIQVGASLCGGWSYAYLRSFFQQVVEDFAGVTLDDSEVFARMNAHAQRADGGAYGLSVDPRFSGSRTCPSVRGSIKGIGVDNLTPANMTRAFIEGMVRELYEMAQCAGTEDLTRVVATGNAARKNPAVREVIEALFGLPCELGQAEEEAALGAARATAEAMAIS